MNQNTFKLLISLFVLKIVLVAQDPSDVEWQQIKTDHYRIIFPAEIYSHANRIANRMEYLYPKIGYFLTEEHNPVSLILSNRSVVSNGFVSAVPWRSEWYSLPFLEKSISVGDWYNTLSLHETRHIFQYSFLDRGFIKLFRYIFGSYGKSVSMNLMIPDWFMEGDAILSETLFSHSGRGRSPGFQQGYRALLLTNPEFKYEKARFGSYRDYTPDDYVLGYFMTSHVAREHGYATWQKILNKATWFSFKHPTSPMSGGIDKFTKYKNTKSLFYGTQQDLRKIWQAQDSTTTITPARPLVPADDRFFTNYTHPHRDSSGNVYFVKSGFAEKTAVYRKSGHKTEKILDIPHSAKEYGIDISDNKIAWAQYTEDKRWNKSSWTNIAIYNMATDRFHFISHQKNYLQPAISPNEKFVAVVEYTKERKCSIVILDAPTGKIINKYSTPNHEMAHYPSWSRDNKKILFTSTGFSGRAIYELDIKDHKFNQMTVYSYEDIFRPIYTHNFIIYESDYSGIDNIYAVNKNTGEKFQITSRKFGANYPEVDNNILIFSDYTTAGYRLMADSLTAHNFTPLQDVPIIQTKYFKPLLSNKFRPVDEQNIPQRQYQSSPYNGLGKYFNFHSYSFLATEDAIGGILFSDNILGTLSQSAYFLKDYENDDYDLGLTINYLGLYPKITMNMNFASRFETQFNKSKPLEIQESWKELELSLYTNWPLFRQDIGITTNTSHLIIGSGIKKVYDSQAKIISARQFDDFQERNETTFPFYFLASGLSIREKALQDLVPTYSQLALYSNISISGLATTGSLLGWQFSQGLNLGNMRGLIMDLVSEEIEDKGYSFDETITRLPVYDNQPRDKTMKFRATVKQHLWFPDIDFFWFLYVKRFYLSLLYEQFGKSLVNFDENQHALGAGLTTEFGGIATIKANFQLSVFYYYNPKTSADGIRFYLDF